MAGCAVAAVAVAAGLAWRGGDAGGGSACLRDLAGHLPAGATFVSGGDLEAARRAGYDDADPEAIAEQAIETGVVPDPVTQDRLRRFADDQAFPPAAVRCWVGDTDGFVAAGDLGDVDVDTGARADGAAGPGGAFAVDGDLLARASDRERASALLEEGDPPPPLLAAVGALAAEDVASFQLVRGPDDASGDGGDTDAADPWAGTALAGGEGGWDLVAVWAFAEDGGPGADAGEDAVREALGDSSLGDLVEGDPADALRRSGDVLVLRAPLAVEPTRWSFPIATFDPALFPPPR